MCLPYGASMDTVTVKCEYTDKIGNMPVKEEPFPFPPTFPVLEGGVKKLEEAECHNEDKLDASPGDYDPLNIKVEEECSEPFVTPMLKTEKEMPKVYTQRTNRRGYTEDQIRAAIDAVKAGRPIREVGRAFGIAESTIRLRKKSEDYKSTRLGRKSTFSTEMEEQLAEYVQTAANLFYGLTPIELRRLAFEFAEANNVKNSFNSSSKQAGKDWLALFLKRNPAISLRKPEGTSINRIGAFKDEVSIFFRNLKLMMEKHQFSKTKIFNVDETGISTMHKPGKILNPKEYKQFGAAISWERGKNITVVCAVNAAGNFVPPMFVYPRKRMCPQLQKVGPVGAIYECSKNGWINEDLFFHWLQHFNQHVKSSTDEPVLLILDNHSSHISLRIVNYCRQKGIIMVSVPPHTSHRLQPLNLTFYGPLKQAFNWECDLYLKNHTHEKITPYVIAEIFNRSYLRTASIEKGISGFRTAGIFPLFPEKFNQLESETIVEVNPFEIMDEPEALPQPQIEPHDAEERQPGPSRTAVLSVRDIE